VVFPRSRILVFAKAALPGRAKTRLIPALGAAGAADLHRRLVLHTLQRVTHAALCPVQLWCAHDKQLPFFKTCAQRFPLELHQQSSGDLGERMFHALSHALNDADQALIIGTDCPTLDASHFRAALSALKQGDDAALTPAADGGYVMLGVRRSDRLLFSDIAWGGDTVLSATRQRLESLDWRWREAAVHHDIDRPEDLALLEQVRLEGDCGQAACGEEALPLRS